MLAGPRSHRAVLYKLYDVRSRRVVFLAMEKSIRAVLLSFFYRQCSLRESFQFAFVQFEPKNKDIEFTVAYDKERTREKLEPLFIFTEVNQFRRLD